ncbi:hypothetical protein MMC15_006564 [Xylographa vitiligo]|nr:hypothetical protein [Xylographa vitiligo]
MKALRDFHAFTARRPRIELRPEPPRGGTEQTGVQQSSSPPPYSLGKQCDIGNPRPRKLAVECGEKTMDDDEEIVDAVSVEELKNVLRVYCVQDYLLPAEFGFCPSTLEDWGLKATSCFLTSDRLRTLGLEWREGGQRRHTVEGNKDFQKSVMQPTKALRLDLGETVERLMFSKSSSSYIWCNLYWGSWSLLARALINDKKTFKIIFNSSGPNGKEVDLYRALDGRHAYLQNKYFKKLVSPTEFVPSRTALEHHQKLAIRRLRRGSG